MFFVFWSSGLGQTRAHRITIPRISIRQRQPFSIDWVILFGGEVNVDITAILFKAFVQAGFAHHPDNHELLPCPTGTFVNSFERDPTKLECLKCPAGIKNLTIHQMLHQTPAVQALITFCL